MRQRMMRTLSVSLSKTAFFFEQYERKKRRKIMEDARESGCEPRERRGFHRGTSLIRNNPSLGTYSMLLPWAQSSSWRGGCFLSARVMGAEDG